VRLSVVIPTFNRKERLLRTLLSLQAQRRDMPAGVEVIVVDDGSSDGTRDLLGEHENAGHLRALFPEHGGPARARNAGARAATGDILVLIGDDIIPLPGFLLAHDRAHRETGAGSRAVLGRTEWDPSRMRITPLLTHLDRRGLQFGYDLIPDPDDVPAWFFYASNVSLPLAAFLRLGAFDESFGGAAWEDVEFALRAVRAPEPLQIVYRPEARALHDHPTSLTSFRARQHSSGCAAAILARRWPETASSLEVDRALSLGPRRPLGLRAIEVLVRSLDPLGVPLPGRLYDKLFRWDYLAGLKEALENPPMGGPVCRSAEAAGLHHPA
jgi:glycosyltransferase involved in cell wall biosynthesis